MPRPSAAQRRASIAQPHTTTMPKHTRADGYIDATWYTYMPRYPCVYTYMETIC